MNLNQYKFIVSSGCSYGVMMKNLIFKHTYLNDVYINFGSDILEYSIDKDRLIFLGAGLASQSSEWALHSTQYIIDKLLKLGVDSNNIYCFVEWTQYDRITNSTENYIDISSLEKHNVLLHNTNNTEFDKLKHFTIQSLRELPNIGIIDNCCYINSNSLLPKQIEKILGVKGAVMYEKQSQVHKQTTNISFIKNYLNNITSLQNYLNSNKIQYNFCNMQSEFDGWVVNGFEFQQKIKLGSKYNKYHINKKHIVHNLDYNNVKNVGLHITDVYPQIKHLYQLIDFSKWWFYKDDGFNFGGIDEFFLHKYDIYAYSNLMHYTTTDPDLHDIIGGYNWHPTEILYTLLHNTACFNNPFVKVKENWENYLINLLNEDINCKEITKHKIACSKFYYENIMKYEHTKI